MHVNIIYRQKMLYGHYACYDSQILDLTSCAFRVVPLPTFSSYVEVIE